MAWAAYQIRLRLRGPLHVGAGRLGNVQYARPYVTGRAFWGALAARLTRDGVRGGDSATESPLYRVFGDTIHRTLAFTYFYPAVLDGGKYHVVWPWNKQELAPLYSSYTATATDMQRQAALQGSLHETEMIAPYRTTDGAPVSLLGYVFENDAFPLVPWRDALNRMRFGADGSYGWGWVEQAAPPRAVEKNAPLFGTLAVLDGEAEGQPAVVLTSKKKRLPAHAACAGLDAEGTVEPLVGREWQSDFKTQSSIGQYVAYNGMCFAPGSTVRNPLRFRIGDYGVWYPA